MSFKVQMARPPSSIRTNFYGYHVCTAQLRSRREVAAKMIGTSRFLPQPPSAPQRGMPPHLQPFTWRPSIWNNSLSLSSDALAIEPEFQGFVRALLPGDSPHQRTRGVATAPSSLSILPTNSKPLLPADLMRRISSRSVFVADFSMCGWV